MKSQRPKLSSEAQIVWDTLLSKEEKLIIRKEYPIKKRRNELIRKLKIKGVRIVVLAEVSGLSDSSIDQIVANTNDIGRSAKDAEVSILIDEIRQHKDLFGRLYDIAKS